MEQITIDISQYYDLVKKLHTYDKAMRYAKEAVSAEPLRKLCTDQSFRELAVERLGKELVDELEQIGERQDRLIRLHQWAKKVNPDGDERDNCTILNTCMGDDIVSLPALHFVYAFSGNVSIVTEREDYVLKEGQLAILDTDFPHSVRGETPDSYIINWLIFKPYIAELLGVKSHRSPLFNEFFSRAFYPGGAHRDFVFADTRGDETFRYYFTRAVHEFVYKRPFSLDQLDVILMEIVICLMRDYSLLFDAEGDHLPLTDKIKTILDYIDMNLQDVTLASAAGALFFSPNHLSRLVKQQTGSTFLELVHKARLREATFLLRDPEMSVVEVAHLVGYNNLSYFYRIFREKYGMSPKDYRKTYGSFSEKYRMQLNDVEWAKKE